MLRTGICNKMITFTHKKTTFNAIVATSTTISNLHKFIDKLKNNYIAQHNITSKT